VCVVLTFRALRDWNEAIYQLAHEVVHVLAPVPQGTNTKKIEEGVAVQFALTRLEYADREYPTRCRAALENYKSSYLQPLRDYEQLRSIDPDAIKKIRAVEPRLWRTTADIILQTVPNCDRALAERLAVPASEKTPLFKIT
jgi:hypothetical protein